MCTLTPGGDRWLRVDLQHPRRIRRSARHPCLPAAAALRDTGHGPPIRPAPRAPRPAPIPIHPRRRPLARSGGWPPVLQPCLDHVDLVLRLHTPPRPHPYQLIQARPPPMTLTTRPGTPRRDASPRPATPQGHAAPLRDLVPSALLAGPCRPRRHRRLFRFPRRLRCTIPPEPLPPTPPAPGARTDPPPFPFLRPRRQARGARSALHTRTSTFCASTSRCSARSPTTSSHTRWCRDLPMISPRCA